MISERLTRAVASAVEARPRPIVPAAVDLLREHEALLVPTYGDLASFLDVCDASAFLTWALRALGALILLRDPGLRAVAQRTGVKPAEEANR